MPVLKNHRHERLAQELAKGKSATDAMRAAGYSDPRNSSRLTKNDEIRARVAELQGAVAEKVIEKTGIDRAKVLEELGKIGLAGIGSEHVRAADKRAALVDIARIEGWIIERSEHGAPGEFDRMSDDELRAYLASGAYSTGAGEAETRNSSGGRGIKRQPH